MTAQRNPKRPAPSDGTPTIGALVDDLGLEVLARSEAGMAREVRSVVRLSQLEEGDVHTLEERALVVADGVAPGAGAEEWAQLFTLLAERAGGLAILAPDADPDRAMIPAAAIATARERGVAVLRLRSGHVYEDLARSVEIAALRSEIALLQRVSSAQEYLLAAMCERRPVDELVDRLGWLLGGEAFVFNDGGEAVIATSAAAAPAIWTAITVGPEAWQDLDLSGRRVTTLPIRIDGRVRYWLAVSTRVDPAGRNVRDQILEVGAHILELVARSRGAGAEAEERAARAQLLSDALSERDPSRLAELGRRAEHFGINFAEPCRIALVLPAGRGSGDAGEAGIDVGERLRALLAGSRTPYLLDERSDEVAALLQGDCCSLLQRWVLDLADDGERVVVGLGRAHAELREARDSLLDARIAVNQISGHGEASVLAFEDSALTPWLVGSVAPHRLRPKVDAMLDEVRANPALYETLVVYLQCDLDLRRAAGALHLHVNSVRYRLGRIEHVLGRSLAEVATLADLYIAVTADATSDAL